jgi:chromate transporter
MWKTANIKLTTIWVPVLTAVLIWLVGISPVWIIVAVVAGTFLYGFVSKLDDEKEDKL